MKLALLTLVIGDKYQKAVQLGLDSKQEYCQQNGYDFIIGDRDVYDKTRPIAWSKIKMLQKYLPKYDYVFCSDADVILMNWDIKLEDLIDSYLGVNNKILVTHDWQSINTGNIILKNSPEIINLLENIYRQKQFMNHNWWEQQAFIYLYETTEKIRKFTRVLHNSHLINAYATEFKQYPLPKNNKYRTGDFLIHLAGIDNLTDLGNLMKMCYDIKQKEKNEGFNQLVSIIVN